MVRLNRKAAISYEEVISHRHSVRSYDPTVQITQEEIREILAEAITAPSAVNLQPWRFLVIDEADLKNKLFPIAFNQSAIVTSSAVIAVLGDLEWYKNLAKILNRSIDMGVLTEEKRNEALTKYGEYYTNRSLEQKRNVIRFDTGLVSMQILLAARSRGYDTVPMAGFDPVKFAQEFAIPARYEPILLIPIGKAVEPAYSTVRLNVDEVTSFNRFEL